MMTAESFTIRVYGLMIDEAKRVLVSDEFEYGMRFTKFPGGGLEWGEGTLECLKREWREELRQEIDITGHFYTTDFFLPSAFDAHKQVMSIYYLVHAAGDFEVKISDRAFDFEELEGAQSFRWVALKDFTEETMTFPIDKHVATLLLKMSQWK